MKGYNNGAGRFQREENVSKKINPKAGEWWMTEHGGAVLLSDDGDDSYCPLTKMGENIPCWNRDGETGGINTQTYKGYGPLIYRCNPDGTPYTDTYVAKVSVPVSEAGAKLLRAQMLIRKIRKCKTIRDVRLVLEQYDKKGGKK